MLKKKPTAKTKLRPDMNETAHRVMLEATGQAPKMKPPHERSEDQKDPAAAALGSRGGKKGGEARKKSLSPERRREIARRAAKIRWAAKDEPDG